MLGFERELVYSESINHGHSLAHQAVQACKWASATGSERQIRKLVSCIHKIVLQMLQCPDSLALQDTALAYLRKLSFDSATGSQTNIIYPLQTSGVIPAIILAMKLYSARHESIASNGLELLLLLCSSGDLEDMIKCRRAVQELHRAGGLDVMVSTLVCGCAQKQLMAACILKKMVVFYTDVNMLERMQSCLVGILENKRDGRVMDENIRPLIASLKKDTDGRLYWHRCYALASSKPLPPTTMQED